MIRLLASCFLLLTSCFADVRYIPAKKLFVLETEHTSYVLGVNEMNALQHVYWGKKIAEADLPAARAGGSYAFESREGMLNEEYPGWGGMRYIDPCLKVTLADGVRDLVLKYVSHQVEGDMLRIRLKDIKYDLFTTLSYSVYPHNDVIERHSTVENRDQTVAGSGERAVRRCGTCRRAMATA